MTYDTGQFGAAQYANFDLQNGVLGTVLGGTATITSAGNGWYRCSFSRTATSTGTGNRIYTLLINSLSATRAQSFIGDTVSGAFIWGIQLEEGSTATAYQPIATTQQAYISSQFKYNLVNPVDSDAAFRLVFNGGWTHSSTGALPNGTNGYADTNVINNTNLTDRASHWSMYFRTLVNDGFNGYYQAAAGAAFGVQPKDSTTKIAVGLNNLTVSTVTSALGYYVGSVNSTTLGKLYVNNSNAYNTITPLNINANLKFYIGALNSSGTAIIYSSNQCSFSTLGDKLTDTEASNLYSRVNTFQTALSRNV